MKSKFLPLLLATIFATAMLPGVAFADTYVGSFTDKNGARVDAYEDDAGENWFIVTNKDGTVYTIGVGNPDPNGSGKTGPSSAGDVQNLLKKVKNAYAPKKNAEQTIIGKYMNASGKGFAPHGNPGDTGYGDKGAPTLKTDGPTKAEIDRANAAKATANFNAKTGNNMNNDMSGGLGGGGEGPGFNKGGKGGGKGGSGDNSSYTDGQNKTIGKTESLGPKPEVVNPPISRGKKTN